MTVTFFSTPRHSGRGGGLVAVFKNHFNCRLLNSDHLPIFEVQLVGLVNPLLTALVYRPPKIHKDFTTQFEILLNLISLFVATLTL